MFSAVKEAKLSVDETARILRVSRVAVFNWKAKRTSPHPQLEKRIVRFTEFLEKLLDLEKLPLPDDLSREERRAKVDRLKAVFEKLDG